MIRPVRLDLERIETMPLSFPFRSFPEIDAHGEIRRPSSTGRSISDGREATRPIEHRGKRQAHGVRKKGECAHDVALSGSIAAHEDRRIAEFDTSRQNTAETFQYELPDKWFHLSSSGTARFFNLSFPTPWKVAGSVIQPAPRSGMASSSGSSARRSARVRDGCSCRRCPGTPPLQTLAPAA